VARAKDGSTLGEHLAAAAAAGSVRAALDLLGPDLPLAAAHLWQWFLELDSARGSNGWGLNPVGYAEIEAWARLTRRSPAPWEIEILRALDRARLVAAEPKEEGK
jgi:hypothetical protein